MNKLVEFLVKRAQKEHSVFLRTLAMIFGGTLFVFVIPAFIFWVGRSFLPQPILPVVPAQVASGVFFVLGLPLMIWSIAWQLFKGKGTPVPVVPTKHLLQSGPYRYMRNPMMLGFFLYLVGWALFWNQWGCLLAACGIVAFLCAEIKFIEEPELIKRFGIPYQEYKKETPFMFPGIHRASRG